MAYESVLYEKKGPIAYVTLNRPQALNALTIKAHDELWEVWSDFRDDKTLRVAILTGAGDRAFCAGFDIKDASAHQKEINEARGAGLFKGGFGGITDRFDIWKPIIAAVNGFALGGGTEISLACDIVVASEKARFGLPEPRLGIMASEGGVVRMVRQLPLKLAMGLLLTGKQIDAREAHRLGLVNEVTSPEQLMPAAERWAGEVLECAPLSVEAIKQCAMLSQDLPLEEARRQVFPLMERMWRSKDMGEGFQAFVEKRKPQWRGE